MDIDGVARRLVAVRYLPEVSGPRGLLLHGIVTISEIDCEWCCHEGFRRREPKVVQTKGTSVVTAGPLAPVAIALTIYSR